MSVVERLTPLPALDGKHVESELAVAFTKRAADIGQQPREEDGCDDGAGARPRSTIVEDVVPSAWSWVHENGIRDTTDENGSRHRIEEALDHPRHSRADGESS